MTILGNLCHFSLHYCCMSDHKTGKYCELFLLGNENRLLERFLTFLLPHGKKELLVQRIHFTTHPWGYCYIGVPALGHGRSQRSAAAGIFSIRWQLSQIMENYRGCLPGQKCNYAVL